MMVGPLGGVGAVDPEAPIINAKKRRWRASGPLGGLASIHDPQVCCDLHAQHR
jgi:hypothetical protein